jgi:uncharacterized membrane protein YgdD (TMEM256/DUF423 family)
MGMMKFWNRRLWMTIAACGGFVAVAIGAFAAHGLIDPQARDWMQTGASYGFMHTMATFACATFINIGAARARYAPAFFIPGVVIFTGTLYAMALGAPRWLGAITPVGGVLFLCGWAVMVWAAWDIDRVNQL